MSNSGSARRGSSRRHRRWFFCRPRARIRVVYPRALHIRGRRTAYVQAGRRRERAGRHEGVSEWVRKCTSEGCASPHRMHSESHRSFFHRKLRSTSLFMRGHATPSNTIKVSARTNSPRFSARASSAPSSTRMAGWPTNGERGANI